MTTQDFRPATERAVPVGDGSFFNDVYWGSIIVGALAAAALAFVLHSFAVAIGLAQRRAAATDIFNDERAEQWFHLIRPGASDSIECTARRKGNYEADRPRGISLRPRATRDGRHHGSARGEV